MNWNWREEFTKKNLLKTAGYIIMLIVLWYSVNTVKSQMDTYCLQKYAHCICSGVPVDPDAYMEGVNFTNMGRPQEETINIPIANSSYGVS